MDYPRVLMVSRTEIDPFNSQGAARGGWFRSWPKEHLAHIFSSKGRSAEPFSKYSYQLSADERHFGWLFNRIKAMAMGPVGPGGDRAPSHLAPRQLVATTVMHLGKQLLLHSGLWEVLFPPKLSPELRSWVQEFRPEVIYAAVTDLSYMRLVLLLRQEFRLPICLHIDDDWPNTLYRNGILGKFMFPLVDRTFRLLASKSAVCMTIGEAMARDYERRYRVPTVAVMCSDEPERFLQAEPIRDGAAGEAIIAYVGGLHLNRWRSLLDLFQAVSEMRSRGAKIGINVHVSSIPHEARASFASYKWVRFLATPPHEQVPGILKGADILFLTEGFDKEYLDYIRLSVSSKAQVYMMSGRPVLVYGPNTAGVVEYARRDGWAYVVDRPDKVELQVAIERILSDSELRHHLRQRSQEVALRNHNANVVRENMRSILSAAKAHQPCPAPQLEERTHHV